MKLDLSNRGLTSLKGIDLSGITELDCSNNLLTSLPALPKTLKRLYCSCNLLTSLPDLPDSLITLYCGGNRLSKLPDLPWGLYDYGDIQFEQHNRKRIDLGMEKVDRFPSKEAWNEVNEKHIIWKYRLGGEKWAEARKLIE